MSPDNEGVKFTFGWEHLDKKDIPEVDAIIHLAGKAHDTKNRGKADEYFAVNTELTKKIYDYFLASKARKFIFFSSVKAAADTLKDRILDEDVIPAPVGPYGESKLAAEEAILQKEDAFQRQMVKNGEQSDKKTYILRSCMIHGPGNKGNLNLLYGMVKKGIPWPLGAFENKRSFTSIDNVSFVVSTLLCSEVEEGLYNLNDDEAFSTNELIEIICEAMGRKAHIWRIPCWIMEGVAMIGGWLHLPLDSERFKKLTESYVSSSAKLKKAIGIEQLPVRAKDGFLKTIHSFELSNRKQ